MTNEHGSLSGAIEDFRRARFQAEIKGLLSRLTGESNQLLSYDDVRQKLRLQGGYARGVEDIPLDSIVGSVGRYSDFTRDFLPRHRVQPERWARVKLASEGMLGLPPIEVYRIGDAYFVQDGNHRVSVARQSGAEYIQAYVTEVHTHIPLAPDVSPDDLILKAEYSQFLEQTHLDRLRPDADLSVTIPGQYPILLEHIDVHRYFMGLDFKRPIPYEEAVTHWYDHVYQPIVQDIRRQGILRGFPGRTDTDFYLWISENRRELEEELGFPVRTEVVINQLAEGQRSGWISRLGGKLLDLVIPSSLESGPPTGTWRDQIADRPGEQLFIELLVPINGKADGWCALEQAIRVARREKAILHGLHVLAEDEESQPDQDAMYAEFERRCRQGGVQGDLVLSEGEVVDQTCLRAAATDMVVVNLTYPPGVDPRSRLASGFRALLNRSPRPVLATPQTVSGLEHALLAFDGSPKAREAMVVADYLAQKWGIQLDVLTVQDGEQVDESIAETVRSYLESHHVRAGYRSEHGAPGEKIIQTCEQTGSDFIVMGGYGLSPILEVMLGSTVDQVLRATKVPVLICR